MHVEKRFEENQFTVEGKTAHRRVDQLDHVLPDADDAPTKPPTRSKRKIAEPDNGSSLFAATTPVVETEQDPPTITRSVPLGSDILGITAVLDLVSSTEVEAVPVETKRGRVPDNPDRSYEPERVQLMAQGLLLREAGYAVDHGVLYFAESRTRVTIPFSDFLEERTRELISQARIAEQSTELPPPLEDSAKCRGCSLNAICLPDETVALRHVPADPSVEITHDGHPIRRLYPVRDDATPLYIQEPYAKVGTSRGSIVVSREQTTLATARLQDVSQLVLAGNIAITAPALHLLAEAGIPIVHLSMGHWFYAITHGQSLRNAFDRAAQFAAAADPVKCLDISRQIVLDKAQNQRTLIRRNVSPDTQLDRAIVDINDMAEAAKSAENLDQLRGYEGTIAARYFSQFSKMLKPRDFDAEWQFDKRNRRPPLDPVNALLSFGYALLAKEVTVALLAEGLDPYWGFYHVPRHGRPALALDLMEPFRPAIVDSAVITAINTGMVGAGDFVTSQSACLMQPTAKKAFIRAYESRLDTLITHPVFDYKCSWRIIIRLQARLLSRWLRGDVPVFTSVTTR